MQNLRVLLRLAGRKPLPYNQTDLCYLLPAGNRFTNSHVLVSLVNSHNQVTVYSHQTAQRYN